MATFFANSGHTGNMEDLGVAYVFINFEQAVALGHIGWGFLVDENRYFFGSTDHLWNRNYPMWHPAELYRYMDVQLGANNDYWSDFGTEEEMLNTMRSGSHMRYHSYKCVSVANPNPTAAIQFAESMKNLGWNVLHNNCVHQGNAVLTKYGGILPSPNALISRTPRQWFSQLEGESIILRPRTSNIASPARS